MTQIKYEKDKKNEESTGTDSFDGSAGFINSNELIIDIDKPSVSKKEANGLSTFTKVCFAAAGLPYQVYFCVFAVFLTVFLLDKAHLPPAKSTYILFISRLIDAITDPIYGFLVNVTPMTKYGKMKPWIIISTPLTIVSYLMCWYVPSDWSEDGIFYWFLFWHSFFFTVITGVRIPHTAMTMYLSKNQEDRQSATIFRMGFELFGILVALVIQGPFVIGDSSCKNSTNTKNDTDLNNSTEFMLIKSTTETSLLGDQPYFILAIIMSIIYLCGNLLLIIFVKERTDIDILNENENKNETQQNSSTLKELKQIFTYKIFYIFLILFVFNQLTIQIAQANIQLYFEYGYYAIKSYFVPTIIVLLLVAIVLVPVWQFIMKKIGKRYSLIIGNTVILPLMVSSLFFRSNALEELIPFYFFIVFASNTFTVSFLAPWAMLPEFCDEYFLKFKSRPDALFYTFFVLGAKILIAVYLGLFQLALDLVGFENGVCPANQKEGVSKSIIYLYAPIPLAFSLISSIATFFYPINEEKARNNTALIAKINIDTQSNSVNSVLPDSKEEKSIRF